MAWDYPVFLDLRDRRCLVIGGGSAVCGRVRGLLDAGAAVTLLAPDAPPELEALAAEGAIARVRRDYRPGDLEGFFLAVSTYDDRGHNEPIWREALSRNMLFNAVDDPPRCGFAFPSVHRQGGLTIAISTNGKCPALAVRLREKLAAEIGPEYAAMLEVFGQARDEIAAAVPDFGRRKRLWYRLVDSALRQHGAQADRDSLRALVRQELEKADVSF
jgi:precorrin-2 dehydrogenase / sirohydrochlorin ferrochelatase